MKLLHTRHLLRLTLLLCLSGWLIWLGYDSWQQLSKLEANPNRTPSFSEAPPRQAPDPMAIAQLFGVLPTPADEPVVSIPLNLLACLVEARPEQSRALIASPEGSRFYRLGEALPGGTILSWIGTHHVRIKRQNNEQTLAMSQSAQTLLIPLPAPQDEPEHMASQTSHLHLANPSL